MATRDGKRPPPAPPPPSQPAPAPPDEDVNWDDDTVPRLDFDDPAFDRVTAIPELPSEFLARQMEAQHGDEPPTQPTSEPPFELSSAITSSADSEVPNSQLSTAPPARPALPSELVLEIDDSALHPPEAPREPQRAMSLELDLSGLDPARSAPPSSDPKLREIADRYATGDFSGALVLAEGVLEAAPDHGEALRYANNCRDVLMQMYSARLGSLDQRVTVAIPSDQIRWLSLDHRSGFLLSLVDGSSSVEELLDISGMAKLDALRILYNLREERVIALVPRGA
ncbi:MAG: hypothetical protein QM756_13175 [Polyangiaceae bacterium]